jgi:hypothetical protein
MQEPGEGRLVLAASNAQVQTYLLYWYKSTNIGTRTWRRAAGSSRLERAGTNVLALLVQKYKYWHKSTKTGTEVQIPTQIVVQALRYLYKVQAA